MLRTSAIALALVVLPFLGGCGQDRETFPIYYEITLVHGDNSRPYLPWPSDVAKQVAGDLEDVGIKVRIEQQPWNSYLEYTKTGQHQMALLGWSPDVPDADNFLFTLLHSTSATPGSANNISFYRNPEYDELLDKARASFDEAERAGLYRDAQQLILRDSPLVPLVYTDRMIAHAELYGPLQVEFVQHPILRLVETPKDGHLIYLRGADSPSLDPGDVTDGEASKVIEQVFDTLVRYKSGTSEIEPGLATSWESNEDKTVWTFQIREGVSFHDGTALDAAAVVTTFERMRDPEHPFSFGGGFTNWNSLLDFVTKVEQGSHGMEVVFRCERPAPTFFIQNLAMFSFSIMSPAGLEKYGRKSSRNPVGTGPFKLVRWDSGSEIELERNSDYWGGAPALQKVTFKVSDKPPVRTNRLISGSVHVIDNLSPGSIELLKKTQGVTMARRPQQSVGYLSMNTQVEPFNDPLLREAVAYALNKSRIIRLAYKGNAEPATVLVPPSLPFHAGDLKAPAYNRDKARELVVKAAKARDARKAAARKAEASDEGK